MASVQIHNPSAFNITNFLNNMGQVIETANSAKTDQGTYEEKKHTAVNGISEQLKVHATSMELIDDVETLYSDKRITDETANGPYENSNQSNTRQAEEIIESNMSYENEEYLCTGETLDEKPTVPNSNNLDVDSRKDENDEQGEKELQHSMDWSEKKRQFSLMKYQYSESSLSSEVSSASRHSFSLYLQAREYDAEEVLVGLGFGFEGPTDIPVRFLNSNSYIIISSQTDSTNSYHGLLQRVESERPELDEVSSRTSFESSWSNSSMDRLPSRFSSSISRLSSVSSLISEPDDNENQSVMIPSIMEPEKEKEHDDGFDLMRHLRLNRGHHEKGFLEPVTEELEVSSVGSDSSRTKISAPQQDSFDSVGNVSIVTKILVQKDDSPVDLRHQKESELTASLTKVNTYNDSSNESLIESTKKVVIVQSSVQEASVDNLHLPSLNNSFASRYTQESFELEEIATSEENLDRIEENTSTMNIRPRNRLKRDHSDDSSGFEDDGGDTSKKSSPEAFDTLKENQSEASHSKQHNTHLLVPVEVSTPKNESSIRRSTFAKRRSWSATKQKRVVFEDEASLKSRSFEDFRADATLSKGDFRSRSLDIPLPLSNRLSDVSREVQDKGSSASNSFDIPTARSVSASDEARTEYSALVVKDESQSDSTDDKDTLTQNKPFSESSAIRNIKYFMSNLLSIRSKLKKNHIPCMTEKLLDLPKSTEIEVCNLEQPSIGADDVSDLRSSLRETSDQGQQIRAMPSITVTSCQKASHYELSTFEEDIQKYRSTFIAMEVISTAQDRYYTRKLQARFAWDILFIRRLRSHIMEELDELRSNLCYARGLPLGAQSQMHSLLRLQSGLRENLLTLAGSTTDMTLKSPEHKNALQSLSVQRSVEDIETKIRESVVQEISSMFEVKINELRDEMKSWLVLFLTLQSAPANSFQTVKRIVTEDVVHKAKIPFVNGKWDAFHNQPNADVISTEPHNYIGAKISGINCLRRLTSGYCDKQAGFSLWMRYGGFISDILGDVSQYHETITQWVGEVTPKDFKWIKCYNSKEHGWDMENFHKNCDSRGPTISLFKVRDDAIFGGFTSASWGLPDEDKYADNAFLFSIKSADGTNSSTFKVKSSEKRHAIYSNQDYGPCFGTNDLFIGNNPHIEGSCSSELGQKYEKATVNDDEAKTILAGSSKFGLTQMEVFYMECFHLHEFLDSNMTGSENFNPQDARLSGGGAIPGTYLQIDLGTKQVISGFAVIAKCSFTLVYLNGVSQEETYNETAGTTKTFTPLSNVLTTYVLKTALLTRIVKFQLTSPSCVFSVELYGCQQECNAALGMQSKLIQNSQISSDNNDDNKHLPIYARANTKLGDKGCWKADDGNYLQIDLLVTKIISMIGIQSCYKQTDHFPSTFKIRYAGDDGVFRNFFGSSEIEILHTYHKKKLGQKISKIKLVPPIVARKLRIYPKDKAEMRVELYGCVYLKDFEGPSTILSTGQMIHNSTRGLALSVVKNSNQENILKTTWLSYTKMEFLNDYPLNRAQWALVVFFNFVLDNTKGHFSTNGHQKRSSSRTSENVPNSVNTPIVMVDPVDNADNVQLSDVMVFDSKSTTSSTILLQQTVMRDGPFEIPSSLDPQGTNSFPLKIISPGWIAHQGCTPTANTGPCSGQASGTRFIYMEGSAPAVKGDTAVLSTYYRVSAYHCFEFWYFMWGQNVGRLNVYLEDSIRKRELVWRLAGSQGNLWRNAKIPINRTRAFKVLIEGVVGDGFMADIAIDKLKFHTNHCDFEPSNASLTKITGFSKSDIIGLKSNHSKYLTQALAGAGIPARFWQPCYQTSQGHNIPHFWSTCGSKGPTVTIVQYKEYIFAAFSDRDWNYSDVSSPLNLSSSRSFILSLSNPSSSKKLFKVNKLFRHEAIQIDPTKGPCFGKAFQLHSGSKISSELGTEYGNAADSSFLTGQSSFVANAVEVLYAGDHPCDAWCSLKGWTCDYVTGKCDCGNDRNYGWCRKGLSQAFLGAFNENLHPDLYWNLDTYPTLHETKTGRTVTLDTDEQGKIKQLESGLSRKALQLNAGDLLLGLYQDTCFNLDIIIKKTFSFAMWLKYGERTEKQFFFTFGSSSEGPVFQLYQTDPSKEILYVKSHFGNKRSVAYFPCPKSVWSHILIVLEGSTSDPTIRVYRNGKVLQTSQRVACGNCNVQDRRADMYISKNGPLYASNASVDEIALWCRALSQDEVKEVHNFFKGPGGFSIHFQLSFPSKTWEDHKDQESNAFKAVQYNLMTKINSIVPSPGAISTTYDCSGPTILNCSVTFDIYNNNGDFIPKFSNNGALGTDVDISLAIYTIVPPEIPKLQGHNTSTTEIALQWDVPESFYSIYQSYNLTWYPVDNPSLINHVVGENYVTSKNLTNLTPYTSYVIRLKLWYLGDVSMNSEPITVWTAEKAPGPVQDLKATSKGSDCLAVYWKKPLDPIEGRIRFFNVTYYGASTRNSTEVGYQSNAVEYMHNICDLQPTTQYNITVTAFTVEYGPASFASGTTAVKGPTAPPGNVSSHNATAPYDDTSTCFLTWNPPPSETLNGNLTSYRLTFVNLLTNKKAYVEIAACNTSAVLRSLEPYRMYSVVLVVTADTGFSPFSPPVYCFTRGTVPSAPPTNTTAVGSTSTSCRVAWGQVPLLFQNGFIMGYNVSYLKHGDSKTKMKHVVVEGSSTNSTEVTGLEKFTHYNVTLAAFTDKGNGPHANLTCRTQEDVPDDVPSELKVVSKSTENCSISWKAPDIAKANGIILGYRIAINDTNSTDSKQSLPEIIFSSCLHAKIVNLKPFRLYNITIQAFNSAGLSNKSELQCMTDEDAPLMAPPNLTCTPITSKQVSAKWSEIPEIQRQGIVRRYVLQFRLLNGTGSIFSLPTNSPARYIRVGPMKEFSLYEVRIAGYTVKMGNYSETPATCMTLEAVPKNPPENVTGNNLTAYSIRVQWDGLSVQPVGILRQWIIYYRIWNASLDTTLNISVPVTQKYIIIDGLELFTLYCIQVAGFTIDVGVKSNCAHIWTDKKVLPPPDGLPAFISQKESSTAKNCSISWAETNNSHPDPDGRVIGYTIYYTPEGSNDTKMVLVTGQNTTSFVLQDLEEYTKYDIQVAAFNIYGAGNKSVSLTCFTKEDVPSQAPVNVKGFNSSSTSIVISWEDIPTRDRNGMIREYRIIIYEVALGNSSVQIITYLPTKRSRRAISVDPHTRAITGLKKFTKYAFQVYGVTIGDGPLSPVIEVTTAEDAPTASPTNLTVVNSSASSLLFTWSNVPEDNRHGIIRYFVIYYWKTEWPIVVLENRTVTIDSVRINPPGRTPEFKFNLTNLEIWTSYTVQVAGFTVRPGVPTKEIALFTDESIPCEPPAFITFDIPKYTQLTVMWTEVNRYCRNGIIRGYRLIYQELLNSPPVTLNFTPSVKTYTLENMNMDANYSIQLLAFTSRGDGNVSYDLAPIDKDGPKKQPMNVLAFNLTTPTAIPVTWSPIPDPIMVERALGYRVSWKVLSIGDVQIEEASWQYFTVRKSSLQATINGLLNFAHYEVHVSGFSRGGRGPSGISSGQTCRCFKRIATNYRVFPPYNAALISEDLKQVNMSGMIPWILNNLIVDCCQSCQSHGTSYVDFVTNGHQQSAFQKTENDVVKLIDDTNDLSFPIYGWKWQTKYAEIFRFIPLVESPGFAFLLMDPEKDAPLKAVLMSTLGTWPYILIVSLMTLIAGIIMWFLDTAYNEEQFPHSYLRGMACGWWWAFISMTTLGYGDKVPVANHSKAFAVVWVLTGLAIYGILSGSICTAFTSIVYKSKTNIYGSEVAAISNSPEYRFAVRRGAKVSLKINYSNFDEAFEALTSRKVTGMLMDANEAGTKKDQFEKSGSIRIQKVFDFQSTFGVVLAGPSVRLYQCSREWMPANRREMFDHISKYMKVIETNQINELVEISTGLLDPESDVFKEVLRYCLMIYGGCIVLGSFYEIWYQWQKRKMENLQASSPAYQLKVKLQDELRTFTNDFIQDLQTKSINLRKRHRTQLIRLHRKGI